MNLREQAELDLELTLEDNTFGFGWPVKVTDPDGLSADVFGQANDIAFQIDPQTGQAVSGTVVEVVLRISTLLSEGFTDLPKSQPDKTKKPWIFEFEDINKNPGKFIVKQSNPDRTLGIILCQLEVFKT